MKLNVNTDFYKVLLQNLYNMGNFQSSKTKFSKSAFVLF